MKIFECVMLICFGISWPISVYKSLKAKTAKGKSAVFIFAIIIGYLSGIAGKIFNNDISYVLVLYCVNLIIVSFDLVLFFINKQRDKITAKI